MNAVVTVCIDKNYAIYNAMFAISRPTIEAYAKKIGAEFVHIDKQLISQTSPHFEKFQIYDLLVKYERIIYIDADAIIRDDCPNLFEIVPPNMIGMFNEGRFKDRLNVLLESAKVYGIKIETKQDIQKYLNKYYNTGVMVMSRQHRDLFQKPVIEDIYHHYEQSHINHTIIKNGIKVFELHHNFNRMNMMDGIIGMHRLNSYIIHYAGILNNVTQVMSEDIQRWCQGIKKVPQHVVLAVGARLGDIISAEPVIRYLVENTYKGSEITIISSQPRVFAHLHEHAQITSFENHQYKPDMPYIIHNCMLPQEDEIWKHCTPSAMHTVDWMSIVCLKHTLPDSSREIKLGVSLEGFAEIIEIMGDKIQSLDKLILVHPGRGWNSKTFPSAYWNTIIEGLLNLGHIIGVIGKDVDEEVGCVPMTLSDTVIDFRNLLNLDGLFTLIGKAPILIGNDSAPIHIAGAFDNHIILIPTCKHPDHVLPYRKSQKYYKAIALYKKLMCAEPSMNPNSLYGYNIMEIPPGHNINEYLPDPKDVISKAHEILST
jgi:hypothetical protein